MSDELTPDLYAGLEPVWSLAPYEGSLTYTQLAVLLKARVRHLLNDDLPGLLRIMYRVDVDETDFRAAMDAPDADEIAERLTHLLLQRELKKLEWRRKFRA